VLTTLYYLQLQGGSQCDGVKISKHVFFRRYDSCAWKSLSTVVVS